MEHQRNILPAPQPQAKHPQEPPSIPTPAPKGRTTIGSYNTPCCHGSRYGIHPPPIEAKAYEIKISLVKQIQESKFLGTEMENPYEHLVSFERLCDTFRIGGVPEDSIKLMLFPFSLGDKARQWEKTIPSHLVNSWDECKTVFLTKFFSNSRIARLRNEISGFAQNAGETFCDAWERFKRYTSKCPHHGFTNASLLSTFYRGVLPKFRMMLDTASNGNFLNKDVEDGWELVENLAQSNGDYNEESDRTVRSNIDSDDNTRNEITSLNEKLDHLLLVHQKQINFVCEAEQLQVQDGEVDQSEEICYMQQQSTMTSPPVFQPHAPPPDFASMFQQLLQGQAAGAQDMAKQFSDVHHNFHDLNTKVEALNSKVQYMESNIEDFCSLLHGTGVANFVGKSNVGVQDSIEEIAEVDEKAPLQVSEDSDSQDGEDSSITQEKTEKPTIELNIDQQYRSDDSARPFSATKSEISMEKRSSYIPPPYKPPLPFPGRFKKRLIAEKQALFDEQMKMLEAKMPLSDALKLIPESHKFLKDLVMARINKTQGMEVLGNECSADIQSKVETEFTVDGQKVKPCMTDQIRLEGTSVPLRAPPWA